MNARLYGRGKRKVFSAFMQAAQDFLRKLCYTGTNTDLPVWEESNGKRSNLNIAQIKRKCGIIERKNYNLPKLEESRQPQCTLEKEEAILETFKHFQLI